jgi:hypothetical protein
LEEYIMENYLAQITIDFGVLADEHEGAVRNERLWSHGAPDAETAAMHEENAETHRQLADWFRDISNNPEWLLDKLLAFDDQLKKK